MISAFLRSLAALIRQLIADGKAVYVTEQTTKEMELLAGLPWVECKWAGSIIQGGVSLDIMIEQAITPADLALGWLLASKARQVYCPLDADEGVAGGVDCDQGDYIDRAAVFAELVALAPHAETEADLSKEKLEEMLTAYGIGKAVIIPYERPLPMYARGTREGARACWAFIVAGCDREMALHGREFADSYRRELEAMK